MKRINFIFSFILLLGASIYAQITTPCDLCKLIIQIPKDFKSTQTETTLKTFYNEYMQRVANGSADRSLGGSYNGDSGFLNRKKSEYNETRQGKTLSYDSLTKQEIIDLHTATQHWNVISSCVGMCYNSLTLPTNYLSQSFYFTKNDDDTSYYLTLNLNDPIGGATKIKFNSLRINNSKFIEGEDFKSSFEYSTNNTYEGKYRILDPMKACKIEYTYFGDGNTRTLEVLPSLLLNKFTKAKKDSVEFDIQDCMRNDSDTLLFMGAHLQVDNTSKDQFKLQLVCSIKNEKNLSLNCTDYTWGDVITEDVPKGYKVVPNPNQVMVTQSYDLSHDRITRIPLGGSKDIGTSHSSSYGVFSISQKKKKLKIIFVSNPINYKIEYDISKIPSDK